MRTPFVGVVVVVTAAVSGGGCFPTAIAAADCCTCLATTTVDGSSASGLDQNCLPDDEDTTRGAVDAEESACAAGAGEAINGNGAIFAVAACLDDGHACADTCAAANADRDVFVDAE
jgi:hypothetical protein